MKQKTTYIWIWLCCTVCMSTSCSARGEFSFGQDPYPFNTSCKAALHANGDDQIPDDENTDGIA